jgi:hypothetical protein
MNGIDSPTNDCFLKSRHFMDESKVELMTSSDNLGNWTLANDHLETAFTFIMNLKEIDMSSFKNIINSNLSIAIQDILVQINLYLFQLTQLIEKEGEFQKSISLKLSLEKLNSEISFFKKTYINTNFTLNEIENLFGFLFHLIALARELQIIDRKIAALNR